MIKEPKNGDPKVARLCVDVPAPTLRALKVRAAQSGTTIVSILNRLIQAELVGPQGARPPEDCDRSPR